MEKISFKTSDNIELSGLLWSNNANKSVLLFHMMPATKESFVTLAEKLQAENFNVLAIDFRGHGESGGGDYKTFAPEQHYGYLIDSKGAIKLLQEKYGSWEIYLGGASIGANIALKEMSENHSFKKGVALSAGLDYYNVRAIDYVKELSDKQKILFVAAKDDMRGGNSSCGEQAETLHDLATSEKEKIIYETGGHGTDMWNEHKELIEQIVTFYKN